MDGFDLIKNLRANPKTVHIPVIMISSRSVDKHRKLAVRLGVSVFLGKPYQEEELLKHIAGYVRQAATT